MRFCKLALAMPLYGLDYVNFSNHGNRIKLLFWTEGQANPSHVAKALFGKSDGHAKFFEPRQAQAPEEHLAFAVSLAIR